MPSIDISSSSRSATTGGSSCSVGWGSGADIWPLSHGRQRGSRAVPGTLLALVAETEETLPQGGRFSSVTNWPSRLDRPSIGRPVVTSHAAIEQAAFRLFAERGFEGTTLDAIASEVGVARRTLFRYFASKNDIPWGQFDRGLHGFRSILAAMPDDIPLWQAVHRGVVRFNEFPPDASPPHVERMRLILRTPALQAHSALRYAEWRRVVADYVAERRGCLPTDLLPQTVGYVSLGLALAAYDAWLTDPSHPLPELLDRSVCVLRDHFAAA